MYTVTRQIQWPEGAPVVEISDGGIDYCNPDALVEKYPGEFCEFQNPVEAVETAISICRAWRKDGEKRATVGIGATGGCTMPFDTCTFRDARKWGKSALAELERCPRCGEIMPEGERYWSHDFTDDKFCSEYCADEDYFSAISPDDDEEAKESDD